MFIFKTERLMHVIFVTGPPWSGKTTQSLLLAKQLGYEYCSPVDWLRIERDFATPLGTYVVWHANACLH